MKELKFDNNPIPEIRNKIIAQIGKAPIKITVNKHGDITLKFADDLTEEEITKVGIAVKNFNPNLKSHRM